MKKTILIDLDGVLNEYKGNYDKDFIPDIKKGAEDFLKKLSENYSIKLFTSRPMKLSSNWVRENNLDKYIDDITNIKVPAYLYIDDRAIQFSGDYDEVIKSVENFIPHYKL